MAKGSNWSSLKEKPQVFGNQLRLVHGEELRLKGNDNQFDLFLFVVSIDRECYRCVNVLLGLSARIKGRSAWFLTRGVFDLGGRLTTPELPDSIILDQGR